MKAVVQRVTHASVKVDGEGFMAMEKEFYAGNLTPGSSQSRDFYLMPEAPGLASGTVTYTYEDSSGEQMSEVQEFSFNINDVSAPVGDFTYDENMGFVSDDFATGEMVDGEEDGIPVWVWIVAAGVGATAAAVIVIVIIVKKKKKGKGEDEEF